MVGMRFERNVRCPAASLFTGFRKCRDLRVRNAVIKIRTFSNDFTRRGNDHAADQRVRADKPNAASRELQRTLHIMIVIRRKLHFNQIVR